MDNENKCCGTCYWHKKCCGEPKVIGHIVRTIIREMAGGKK